MFINNFVCVCVKRIVSETMLSSILNVLLYVNTFVQYFLEKLKDDSFIDTIKTLVDLVIRPTGFIALLIFGKFSGLGSIVYECILASKSIFDRFTTLA